MWLGGHDRAVIGRRECSRARPPSSTHGHATTDPTRLTTRYLGTVNSWVCVLVLYTHTRMNNYYPTNSNLWIGKCKILQLY